MDRDFLLATLAVQMGFASPQQMMAAASGYLVDKSRTLAGRLLADGILDPTRLEMLQRMVEEAIKVHDGDVAATMDNMGGQRALQASLGCTLVIDKDGEVTLGPAVDWKEGEYYDREKDPDPSRYRIGPDPEIGRGGIGRVLIVFDEKLGREIAVKELLPSKATPLSTQAKRISRTAAIAARFLHEARVTGQLEHPNIVPVYEVGRRAQGIPYYTMKLVRGRTLAEALQKCQTLADRLKLLPHFVDLCNAIAYAHARGVIHRDIKTENVMLGEFGETVVLDWGLAKVKDKQDITGDDMERELSVYQDSNSVHTMQGAIVGTPAYMSPEQADGRVEEIDERSDVWSLGAVLYELLTGKPPFEAFSTFGIICKVLADDIVPPQKKSQEIPAELSAVTTKALTRDKDGRYQTAGELAEEINAYMSGGLISAYNYTLWELMRSVVSRHKAVSGLVGLVLLLVVVGTLWLFAAYGVAAEQRDRAELNEAAAIERQIAAEFFFANALEDQAQRLFAGKRFLEARIYAAAMLKHHPANPNGPCFSADFQHPESREMVTSALSIVYQAGERTVLRSVARGQADAVATDPADTLVAWAGNDRWAFVSGKRKVLVGSPSGAITVSLEAEEPLVSLAASQELIAAGGADGMVRVWETATWQLAHKLNVSKSKVGTLAFSPSGERFAACGNDGILRVFETTNFAEIWQLEYAPAVHLGRVAALPGLSFTPDGSQLCVKRSSDGLSSELACWQAASGRLVSRRKAPTRGSSFCFSPDGKLAATLQVAHYWAFVWQVDSGQDEQRLALHSEGNAVDYSPGGSLLLTAANDGVLRLWDCRDWTLASAVQAHSGFFSAAFSPDGGRIVSIGSDGHIQIWKVNAGAIANRLVHDSRVRAIAISPDGKRLASGVLDEDVRLWDLTGKEPEQRLVGHDSKVWTTFFGADSDHLYSGAFDGRLIGWDLTTGKSVPCFVGSVPASDPTLLDDQKTVVMAYMGQEGVSFLDLDQGRIVRTLDGNYTVAVSPDELLFATSRAKEPEKLFVYDLLGGELKHERPANPDKLSVAKYSPDGKWLACAGFLGSLRLFGTATYEAPRHLVGHSNWINRVEFSPDSSLLVTAADDRTVRVWSVETGQAKLVLRVDKGTVPARFTPDGRQVVIADDNAVDFYRLDFSLWAADAERLLARTEKEAGSRLDGFSLMALEAE